MNQSYESPLSGRYSSEEMKRLFSQYNRIYCWRRLWIALAKAESEFGLPISEKQISQMEENIGDIDFERAAEIESRTRHDVMAHIRAFGEKCPDAEPIIHLGATSCYVTDNADMIIMRDALLLINKKLTAVIANFADFALKYKDMPALAYTHLQNAQPTTVGKRATLWLMELLIDYNNLQALLKQMPLLGNKGATGTQASFLKLFNGDGEKVIALEKRIAELMGFSGVFPVSGQTYTRKQDIQIQNVLCGIAQSACKTATDIRLLQSFSELAEPFGKEQVGSSAMAYKRNPIHCERICSLARFAEINAQNAVYTASTQWLERTLDDSANRRITLAEGFLSVDAILELLTDISSGLIVYPKVIAKRLNAYLPYIATENILMEAVKKGGSRQALHEKIRQYSRESEAAQKEGSECTLLEKIKNDKDFLLSESELNAILDPKAFVGLAPFQTERFINEFIKPISDACDPVFRKKEVTI